MAKVTKTELRLAIDAHSQSMASATSARGDRERARELEWVKRTGSELMALLERDMRATVDHDLVRMAQRMVDKSSDMISAFHFKNEVAAAESFADGFVAWVGQVHEATKPQTAEIIQLSDFRK